MTADPIKLTVKISYHGGQAKIYALLVIRDAAKDSVAVWRLRGVVWLCGFCSVAYATRKFLVKLWASQRRVERSLSASRSFNKNNHLKKIGSGDFLRVLSSSGNFSRHVSLLHALSL